MMLKKHACEELSAGVRALKILGAEYIDGGKWLRNALKLELGRKRMSK